MTRSVPAKTSCFVLSALFSAALAGCGDGASTPKIDTAKSSVQRVVDPQVPAADSTTLASDNAAFALTSTSSSSSRTPIWSSHRPASPSPSP